MGAMARVDEIGCLQRRTSAHSCGFLSDDQMNRRLHQILAIAPLDFLFDPADSQHGPIEAYEGGRLVRVTDAPESLGAFASIWITDRHYLQSMRLIEDDAAPGHLESERHADQ